jgi:hypothetical protein
MDITQLRDHVIEPALGSLGDWYNSEAAVQLLIGTAIQESRCKYLVQIKGPALGIFQMEPATHDDIFNNFLAYRPTLEETVLGFLGKQRGAEQLIGNLYYAAAMCRVHYLRAPEALPVKDDIVGMARYWKKWYNTPLGKGTETEFYKNYMEYAPKDL